MVRYRKEDVTMKILLAYDGMDRSRPALEETAAIAAEEGAEVTVLCIVARDDRASVGLPPRHAEEDAGAAQAFLRERGVYAETKIDDGDPADIIIDETRTGEYDLVVTGTRGQGPIARALMGSVSHKVANHARCPVLVVLEDQVVRIQPRVTVRTRAHA